MSFNERYATEVIDKTPSELGAEYDNTLESSKYLSDWHKQFSTVPLNHNMYHPDHAEASKWHATAHDMLAQVGKGRYSNSHNQPFAPDDYYMSRYQIAAANGKQLTDRIISELDRRIKGTTTASKYPRTLSNLVLRAKEYEREYNDHS